MSVISLSEFGEVLVLCNNMSNVFRGKASQNKAQNRPAEIKKILGWRRGRGRLPILKYFQPPWLADEENLIFAGNG